MTFAFDGYNWLVRLNRGELLVENLTKFVREQKIGGTWISGLGAASWAELGFYDLATKQYQWQKIDKPMEILSLQGNVAWEGEEPILHMHGSFGDSQMQAVGGHIKELQVAGTCEVLLHRWYHGSLTRSTDEQTGLKLLDL